MTEHSAVGDFLDAYRAAFEAYDAAAIAELFAYPCQVTSDAGAVSVTAVPTRDAWLPQLERLLAAYEGIGVRSAHVLEHRVTELAPRLAQAVVRWRLIGGEERPLYDFDATYTLADLGDGLRIAAIAHNEAPKLRALLQQRGRNA